MSLSLYAQASTRHPLLLTALLGTLSSPALAEGVSPPDPSPSRTSSTASTDAKTLTVSSERLYDALGPTEGYSVTTSLGATKTDTALNETPHSVSVVTRQQIEDQGAASVQQALRYTPGVFAGGRGAGASRYDFITLRGFGGTSTLDTTYLDGLKLLGDAGAYNTPQIDPYFLERVDVFKGPSSVLYGQNQPGGLVALTSKRPRFTPYRELQATVGTNGQRAARLDVSGPLDDAQTLAFRLVGQADTSDTMYHHSAQERYTLAPSVTLAPSEDTTLTLMAYLQHDPESGFYGFVPAEGTLHARNGQTISRHFFDGEPGTNRFDRYQRMVGYHLEHRINDALTARQNVRYLSMDIDYDQVYARTFEGQSDRLQRGAARSNESLSAYALDNQLQLDVDTGPVKHTLLAGLDYQHRQNTGTWQFGTASALDAFAPRYGTPDIEYGAPTRWRHKVEQTGIYLQDQLALGGWRLSLGGRQDWARATNDARDTGSSSRDNQSQFSGRAGLLYAFENGLSPYLSYSESFNPNTRADASGEVLGPTEGQQYEAGIKYQPPGTKDHYTASLYRLTQTNVAEAADVPAGTPTYYEAVGKVRTHGVELSATTRLTEQFSLLAAYTYTDMEYVKTNDDTEGNTPYEVPRHMASLWGRYDLDDGLLNGVSIGAGARYIGSSWADSDNTTRVGAHTLIDAMLAYDLGKLSPELSGLNARVNATNLLDETYVSSCTSLRNCYYGQERSITATVSYQF
ncbi:TonB-dependent siderophore receptor [Larsenimonas suaedae]|uniref:TonB-dependent siderophore receptor n=1 Tax=Larsenimonas suaedae TaxID=1851019 RepID=A0ABU1GST3_9GAMM|nr:TonB-dependent siderophore receptor [Larsenimonas suaedae]MCM2972127.1 TonB-dependent siderophore receptor [Larsenimonas suaedae]MDR5895079.1 TonB-dependent siderophore receptor [Larsenimonas suaedae]